VTGKPRHAPPATTFPVTQILIDTLSATAIQGSEFSGYEWGVISSRQGGGGRRD